MENLVLHRGSYPSIPIHSARNTVTTNESRELLEAAQEIEREQQAALEAAPVEQTYQEALAIYVQSKFYQGVRMFSWTELCCDPNALAILHWTQRT